MTIYATTAVGYAADGGCFFESRLDWRLFIALHYAKSRLHLLHPLQVCGDVSVIIKRILVIQLFRNLFRRAAK